MGESGTSFTIDLPVTGKEKIDASANSVEALDSKLDRVSKASLAASNAIKLGEAAYQAAQQAADRAAKSVERISVAMEAQRSKAATARDVGNTAGAEKAEKMVAALANRQAEAAAKAALAKTALANEAAALDKLTESAKKAETAESKLANAKAPKTEGGGEEVKFEGLERGLHKLGGPLAEAGGRVAGLFAGVGKLTKSVGAAGPYVALAVVVVAMAAAFMAAAAAAVAATIKIAEWSVGLADANRSASLLAQGIARSVKGGEQLDGKLDDLTKQLPLTREELSGMAANLANAGLRGDNLTNALQRTAVTAAKLKFGPDFAEQMLSLDEQSKVFHANIANLFGGLKIDPLLKGLQTLGKLFDADTASGHAIKVVFESLFQPMVDGAAGATTSIEAFFLKLEIYALKALIWLKPHGSTILTIGKAFLIVTGILVGTFVAAIGVVMAVIATMVIALASPIIVIGAIVAAVYLFRDKITGAFDAVKAWFKSFSLSDVATGMIDGLVNGIKNGGAAILAAMKGAVMGAVDGVKHFLGIASPSKVFAEIGMQTGAGMSAGVDKSADGVQGSLESMVQPPAAGGAPSGRAAGGTPGGAKGSKSGLDLSGASFVFQGVPGMEDAEARFGALLTRLYEGDASQLGATVPAT